MKVYVVMARWGDCSSECAHLDPEPDEGIIMEIFAREQDAKRYKAAADVDGSHGEYFIRPRELRTAWRGK